MRNEIQLVPSTIHFIIKSPIIIHQPQFSIPHLAAPLDGLSNVTGGGHLPEGGVGVGGTEITGRTEDFTDVLGEVPAVCEP